MNKFFDKDKTPSRPGEYIHKRDPIEKEVPIFKHALPSDPKNPEVKPEKKKEPESKLQQGYTNLGHFII